MGLKTRTWDGEHCHPYIGLQRSTAVYSGPQWPTVVYRRSTILGLICLIVGYLELPGTTWSVGLVDCGPNIFLFTRFFPTPRPRLSLKIQIEEAKQPDSLIIESFTESSSIVFYVSTLLKGKEEGPTLLCDYDTNQASV